MTTRRTTDWLVIHCSATRPSQPVDASRIRDWHLAKGWADIGYHYVLPRPGGIQLGRPLEDIGAHVQGYNSSSVGICLVGGLDEQGGAVEGLENYTAPQLEALTHLIRTLKLIYPNAKLRGHRDFSPDLNGDGKITKSEWMKNCPCFNVEDLGL